MDINLIEHLPIGFIIWHLDDPQDEGTFHLHQINRVARSLLNIDPHHASAPTPEINPYQDLDPFPAFLKIEPPSTYAEVVRSGTPHDLGEIFYRSKQQVAQVISLRLFPFPPNGLGAMLEDISDRKFAEEQSKATKQKWLFHAQQTPLAVIEWTLNGEVVEWNPAAEQMFGYKRREAVGHTALELMIPPHDRVAYQQYWSKFLARQQCSRRHSHHVTRTGKSIICEWYNTPLMDEMNHVVGIMSLVEDVTQQQRTHIAIKESEIRYRRLFEASQDGIVILDAATARITDANPYIQSLLGYTRLDLIGKTLMDIKLMPNLSAYDTMLGTLRTQGVARYTELALTTASRQPIVVELVCSLYTAGKSHVIQCQIRDITARQQAEEQLKQFTARLERSNQELQDFAFIASHDLREPLRKIRALGDRLQITCEPVLPPEGLDYLHRIQHSAQRMQSLIDDLLALSRVTIKAQPFVTVDLSAVLQEVLSDLEVSLQQGGGTVLSDPLPTIEADPLQMHQLLQNLISNALKFHHPNRSPVVKLRCQILPPLAAPAGPSDPYRCQIAVTDNGIGFEAQYQETIFTPFQRLHGHSDFEGNGIGLAICRKIAERHGGSIVARSHLHTGTSFIITLPMQQSPLDRKAATSIPDPPTPSPSADYSAPPDNPSLTGMAEANASALAQWRSKADEVNGS